jgi:glutaredoxin 3
MANVIIYTTPTCAYCKATKQFFADNNIEYKEINVAADQKEAQKLIEKSGQMGVPVITIEKDGKEEVVVGFNQPKLAALLGVG